MILLYLAVGGALGTLARHAMGGWVHSWAGAAFPWGTFAVNVLGSFLLGIALRGAESLALSPETRALLTVGFCGAFTTFSTLSYEAAALLQAGAWARAAAYALGSLGLGLAAVCAGLSLAPLLLRR
ncbi:MAG TPA: fluoride efflux transporter CrcB [Longimicrobiaceae bacterium]|nr:fluoride efflux transporter CrcB [Longimicrobiaceae bacterium]